MMLDQTGRSQSELRVDALAEVIEAAKFLASFASVLVVIWAFVQPLMELRGTSGLPYWLAFLFALAIGTFFFLWVSGITRGWRASTLSGALVSGCTLALYPIAGMVERPQAFEGPMTAILVITAFISITFGVRIIRDGWRLACFPEADRALLATVPPDRIAFAQCAASTFGIHPICRWLPNWPRRAGTGGLFLLSTAMLALAIGMAIYVAVIWLSTQMPAVRDACFPASGDAVRGLCAIRVTSSLGPAIAIGLCLAASAGLRRLARRSARMSLETLSRTDKRPAVLFLRSFHDDQVDLALPRRPPYRRLLALGEPAPRLDHLLIEEATPVGPVVAIGLPGRPAPFGAARSYFEEDEWKAAVAKLAAEAKAIVVVIDDTDGVLWELGHIRQAGLATKTLYLLPPRLSGREQSVRLIQRELAEHYDTRDAAKLMPAAFASPGAACIGWYRAASGDFRVLTASQPNSTSYACALRLALRAQSNSALAGLAPPPNAQRRAAPWNGWIDWATATAMAVSLAAVMWLQIPSRAAARTVIARSQLKALSTAMEQYYFDVARYPSQKTGLRALLEAPPQTPGWQGPYIENDGELRDPWGRPYIYRMPGETHDYDIISLGSDGQPGGTGEDTDLTNWE
jgi:general secretion pathway protein G